MDEKYAGAHSRHTWLVICSTDFHNKLRHQSSNLGTFGSLPTLDSNPVSTSPTDIDTIILIVQASQLHLSNSSSTSMSAPAAVSSSSSGAAATSAAGSPPSAEKACISMLWCGNCKAIEFPGCVDHALLTVLRGKLNDGSTATVSHADGTPVSVEDPLMIMSCLGCECAAAQWDHVRDTCNFVTQHPSVVIIPTSLQSASSSSSASSPSSPDASPQAIASAAAAAAGNRRPGVVSTDTCTPWAESCRFCLEQRAQQYAVTIDLAWFQQYSPQIESALAKIAPTRHGAQQGPEQLLPMLLRWCDECQSSRFDLLPPSPREGAATVLPEEEVPLLHVVHSCDGAVREIPILMPKSEFAYLRAALPRTPTLREIDIDSLKEQGAKAEKPKAVHIGVRCDLCAVTPIRGMRFTCSVCPDFDCCEECEALQRSGRIPSRKDGRSTGHSADHPLVQLTRPESLGYYRMVSYSRVKAKLAHTLPAGSQPVTSSPGWPRELFLTEDEGLLDALTCAICLDIVKDAKLTDCQHVYCSFCLLRSAVNRMECPLDRLPIREGFMQTSSPRELALRAQINGLTVACPHRSHGCSWSGCLSSLSAHLASACELIDCSFGLFGCGRLVRRDGRSGEGAGAAAAAGEERKDDDRRSPSSDSESFVDASTAQSLTLLQPQALLRGNSSAEEISSSATSHSHTCAHTQMLQRQLITVCDSVEVMSEQLRHLNQIAIPAYERTISIVQRVQQMEAGMKTVSSMLRNHAAHLKPLWEKHLLRGGALQARAAARGGEGDPADAFADQYFHGEGQERSPPPPPAAAAPDAIRGEEADVEHDRHELRSLIKRLRKQSARNDRFTVWLVSSVGFFVIVSITLMSSYAAFIKQTKSGIVARGGPPPSSFWQVSWRKIAGSKQ
jgi:hypothetical protein